MRESSLSELINSAGSHQAALAAQSQMHSSTKEVSRLKLSNTCDSVQDVTLLGATGSIGNSTLEVIRHNSKRFRLHAIAANTNAQKMLEIMQEFHPQRVALFDSDAAAHLRAVTQAKRELKHIEILDGADGVIEVAGDGQAQIVVGAIVGAAGLLPLLAALKTSCKLCLANKEALVMSGKLFFDTAWQFHSQILPVDSEHSAIFQCLPEQLQLNLGRCNLKSGGINEILLTGSGGPFRELPLNELVDVSPERAIQHPVWNMGPKISVDSATMMNKALEFIEARYLFNAAFEEVKVLIHPQSIVHSMVSYVDGAVLAQMGQPDMKTPIARAMSFPERINASVPKLDFTKLKALTFSEPDYQRYPCLFLGMEASKLGQAATTALNAANEVAVQYYLSHALNYAGIAKVVEYVLNKLSSQKAYSLEEIMHIDSLARNLAVDCITKHKY